jgi:hypothetical protein
LKKGKIVDEVAGVKKSELENKIEKHGMIWLPRYLTINAMPVASKAICWGKNKAILFSFFFSSSWLLLFNICTVMPS